MSLEMQKWTKLLVAAGSELTQEIPSPSQFLRFLEFSIANSVTPV